MFAGTAVTAGRLVPSLLLTHPTPHHGLVLVPTPSAWPCRRPWCQVVILVLPVPWCCSCPALPVPQCYGFSVLGLLSALSFQLHAAPGSPEPPRPPDSPMPMISWLPDAPGSRELSGAPGFPVSLCCSFPLVPACGCPQFYRFLMPTASRFPGAVTPDAPGSPVPTVFPLPSARFSCSLVTCFPMFLVLQLSQYPRLTLSRWPRFSRAHHRFPSSHDS